MNDPIPHRVLLPTMSRDKVGTKADDPYGRRIFFNGVPDEGKGPFSLECSRCGRTTRQSILGIARAHIPGFVWLPLMRYSHYARCPSCGTRSWLRLSLRS